jgi:hypothetical protein
METDASQTTLTLSAQERADIVHMLGHYRFATQWVTHEQPGANPDLERQRALAERIIGDA